MKPSDCKRISDVLSLESSHATRGGRWTLMVQHDGAVILTEQRSGEPATASIVIPRQAFQSLLEWYEAEQDRERVYNPLPK